MCKIRGPSGQSDGSVWAEAVLFFPHLLYPLISTRGLKNIKNVFGREAKSQLRDTHFVGGYSLNLYPSAVRLNKQVILLSC